MELSKEYDESCLLEVAHPDMVEYATKKLINSTNHYFIKNYGV